VHKDAAAPIRLDLREQLEHVAEALGLGGVGQHELTVRFQDGRLRWWEGRSIRVPASTLDGLGKHDTAGSG
jgi:hypothetical protein